MATISQIWTIVIVVTVLAMQPCIGEKSCTIWSSAGPVVQRGSSFKVYCTFNCKCKGSMYSDHPPTLLQGHEQPNSTTIYFKVANITKNRTYSCQCTCPPALDPCGLDISAGYLPEQPKNLSCIYKIKDNEMGVVFCTWNRGRDTFLKNHSALWVRTVSGNQTEVSSKGAALQSATLTLSNSVQKISVWTKTHNALGSATSSTINYTLSDIVMPPTPVLGQPRCSSRACLVLVEPSVRTQQLELQYRAGANAWTSSPDSGVWMSSEQDQSISSLEPYTWYHFRARSKFSTGLWSQWSTNVSSWTQEEDPAKELDVWFAQPAADFKSLRVYWKELSVAAARGKIIAYEVRVDSLTSGLVFTANFSADARNCSVPFCDDCEVTVTAFNSKGPSPPARVTTHHTKVKVQQCEPLQDLRVTNNHSVAISWTKCDTAPVGAEYVVEWFPVGHKLEELNWVRVGSDHHLAVVTGLKPFECYEGAVHVFYNESSVSRARFPGITTVNSAPAVGPSVQETVEGNQVKVTWTEIPRAQRGGCLSKYTIYLEDDSGYRQTYGRSASERTHVIADLHPAVYSLWMTASTAKGEGQAGQKVKFFIQQETNLPPVLVCVCVVSSVLFLVWLCCCSAVKQRFWVYFQCLMLDVVPDPANSKWAKECVQEKGKMNLQLQQHNSGVTKEEEEPILVHVEELPKQSVVCTPADVSSPLPSPQIGRRPQTDLVTPLYPVTNYIQSFSHDSDSSEHTQTSLDTSTTVDYISSPGNMDEEEEEEEEEEFGFFPSHNIFINPLEFGGKLTLNTVKIDCSDFLQNC